MATLDRLAAPPLSVATGRPAWTPRRAIVVTATLVTTIALVQVLQSSSVANTGAQMQRLEAQRNELTSEVHQLEAEVAALSSLDRTERAARERLGMVPARKLDYISVAVEAPSGPLLPRPLLNARPEEPESRAWWQSLLSALRLP